MQRARLILAPLVRLFADLVNVKCIHLIAASCVRHPRGRPPPLVVDLGGSDVPVTEQLLDLHDVHAGIEQERSGGGAERVRGVHASIVFAPPGASALAARKPPRRFQRAEYGGVKNVWCEWSGRHHAPFAARATAG